MLLIIKLSPEAHSDLVAPLTPLSQRQTPTSLKLLEIAGPRTKPAGQTDLVSPPAVFTHAAAKQSV